MTPYHEMEMRAVYGQTLNELIEADPNVYCLEADLSTSSGTNPAVVQKHPDHFINFGIAEANMICTAAGLAMEGKRPFCASFSCFASRMVYNEITVSVAYANANVKIVGVAPGITIGASGGTHMCFEDLAIMRAMPNMHVYSPCDAHELRAVMRHMAQSLQPTYMQLLRPKLGAIFSDDYIFQPGKAVTLRPGSDVTLVSTGYMTHWALRAVEQLDREGVSVELIHCPSIKPFDGDTLVQSAQKTRYVVTVEQQTILGGLGGVVCETLSERCPTIVKRLGIPDRFGEVASEPYLFNKHGFGPDQIIAACRWENGKTCPARR
jgi:transketolase